MFNLPLQPRYVLPPLCLMLLSTVFALMQLNDVLEFNRSLVENGQYWRVFSSQFVHANWPHLALNCAGILLIWALHGEHTSPTRYIINTIFLATWCGLGILLFCPDIKIYTGLSALLHGVIIWGAVKDICVGYRTGMLLFIGVWGKVLLEQVNGPSADVGKLINSTVAIDAHLIGTIGGLILSLPLLINHFKTKKTPS